MLTRGVLVAFDGGTYTATVRPAASPGRAVAGIVVSRGLPAAEMVVGRTVALAGFTAGDPSDLVVVAVWA